MNQVLATLVERLRAAEVERVRGRKVIVFAPVLASATKRVELYRSIGAVAILVLTFGDGTGALPAADDAQVVRLPSTREVHSVMDELDQWRQVLLRTPEAILQQVDEFDPEGTALVINWTPTASEQRVFGREVFGGRSVADEALEDKTLCGAIFAAAGVHIAPEEVVPSDPKSLRDSLCRLDEGAGVVISADASQGMNGGASRVWWVRPGTDPEPVLDEISRAGDRARVMPFLEGQPCSIHGFVAPDGVIVLRPVELCMLRPAGGNGFRQAGISTWWDPTPASREGIRASARSIGEELRRAHGYCGAFGVDGILTADGFLPHELNPRFSAGINAINKGLPDVPLNLLDGTLRAGGDLGGDCQSIEQALVQMADAHRFGTAYLATSAMRPQSTTTITVTGSPAGLAVADDEAATVGTLELGPAAMGALVRFTPLALSAGERLSPWALAAYRLADELWQTGFGEFELPEEPTSRTQAPDPRSE